TGEAWQELALHFVPLSIFASLAGNELIRARGAGLPPDTEWREDCARPLVEAGSGQKQVRASHQRAGVSFSAEKAHLMQLGVERVGADVDGVIWRVAVPVPTAAHCLAPAQRTQLPWRVAMAALGKLVIGELLLLVALLPASATPLRRALVDGMAAAAGASELGGGARASVSLREDVASALQARAGVADQLGIGARPLYMVEDPAQPKKTANTRVPSLAVAKVFSALFIGRFDGIGSPAVAFSRLPMRIVARVAAETDPKARRAVGLFWPGAIDWGDVARVEAPMAQELFVAVSEHVDLCVAAAGSPARISSLNVGGRGFFTKRNESPLFRAVSRALGLLRAVHGSKLPCFVEGAAGMSAAASLLGGARDELVGEGAPFTGVSWEGEGCEWPGRPGNLPAP
ncbi:unnamed protein product, partial [Prorocentrum cordatum]